MTAAELLDVIDTTGSAAAQVAGAITSANGIPSIPWYASASILSIIGGVKSLSAEQQLAVQRRDLETRFDDLLRGLERDHEAAAALNEGDDAQAVATSYSGHAAQWQALQSESGAFLSQASGLKADSQKAVDDPLKNAGAGLSSLTQALGLLLKALPYVAAIAGVLLVLSLWRGVKDATS